MVLEIFSARFREARLEQGLVQADIAGLLGVRSGAVVSYEAGDYLPKPAMLEKISEVTGKPVAWFFTPGAQPLERQPGRPRSSRATFGATGANRESSVTPLEERKATPRKTSKRDTPNRGLKVGDADRYKRSRIQCQGAVRQAKAA